MKTIFLVNGYEVKEEGNPQLSINQLRRFFHTKEKGYPRIVLKGFELKGKFIKL